jgi:hypothetical protein
MSTGVRPSGPWEVPAGRFRVAGFDDEAVEYTEWVAVTCPAGHESPGFTQREDGGADRSADLADLVAWAHDHRDCRPAS